MKGYLVDTNVPSELTRETPDARVAAFLRNAARESLFLSVMTLGEICKGIDMLPVSQKRDALQEWLEIDVRSWYAGRILPVTESIAERWGHMAATAKQRGIPVKVVDAVIAATALEHDLNPRDAQCEGLCRPRRRSTQHLGRGVNLLAAAQHPHCNENLNNMAGGTGTLACV